jgi:antitoxin (DNA-binding transcriptional repressor) of toxin-antitoxin stability system
MRELRHRLRHYLARVNRGERFEVTLFGRPVAFLGPSPSASTSLDRLMLDGKVTPPLNPDTSRLPAPFPITTGVSATAALLDERRSDAR